MMAGRLTAMSLAVGLFYFALATGGNTVFQTPSTKLDLTLVLDTDYLVQWESDWSHFDLWVFCSGSGNGGIGTNGAQLLYGK